MTTSNCTAFTQKLKAGRKSVISSLGARSSRKQQGNRGSRIKYLKKEKNLQCLLLIPKDLELPVDPTTGMESDLFNENTPYRPEQSLTSTLRELKNYYASGYNFVDYYVKQDASGEVLSERIADGSEILEGEVKITRREDAEGIEAEQIRNAFENLLGYLGVDDWDLNDPDKITIQDCRLFGANVMPRVYSFNTMTINLKAFGERSVTYRAGFERDITGTPYVMVPATDEDGEPIIDPETKKHVMVPKKLSSHGDLKQCEIASLFRKILLDEFEAFKATQPNMNEEQASKKKWEILGTSPISNDRYTSYVCMYKIDASAAGVAEGLDKIKPELIRKELYWNKYTKKIEDAIKDTRDNYNSSYDTSVDYFVVEMKVGDDNDDMQRGLNTKFETAHIKLAPGDVYKEEHCDILNEAYTSFVDKFKNSELIMQQSVCSDEIDDKVIGKLAEAIKIERPFDSIVSRIDQSTEEAFKSVICFVYGNSVLAALEEAADTNPESKVSLADAEQTDITEILSKDGESSVQAPGAGGSFSGPSVPHVTVTDEDE